MTDDDDDVGAKSVTLQSEEEADMAGTCADLAGTCCADMMGMWGGLGRRGGWAGVGSAREAAGGGGGGGGGDGTANAVAEGGTDIEGKGRGPTSPPPGETEKMGKGDEDDKAGIEAKDKKSVDPLISIGRMGKAAATSEVDDRADSDARDGRGGGGSSDAR